MFAIGLCRIGTSCANKTSPSGSIQSPSIGKKLKMPPTISRIGQRNPDQYRDDGLRSQPTNLAGPGGKFAFKPGKMPVELFPGMFAHSESLLTLTLQMCIDQRRHKASVFHAGRRNKRRYTADGRTEMRTTPRLNFRLAADPDPAQVAFGLRVSWVFSPWRRPAFAVRRRDAEWPSRVDRGRRTVRAGNAPGRPGRAGICSGSCRP